MPYQPTLNFKLSNGTDLGNLGWITKEYLMSVYPQISNQLITPELWTWGNNAYGNLGNNTITNRSIPVTTSAGGANWKQVALNNNAAAVKTDGTLWTWGQNTYGQLGDNTAINRSTPVTTFAGGTNWKQVATSSTMTVAIKTDGTLWTWGRNRNGNLGINISSPSDETANRSTPTTTFAGGTNWKQCICGYGGVRAIKTDGTLWTWGRNNQGQLGDNTAVNRSTPVTTFLGGTNWKQVGGGDDHTAAVKTDGTLWTWGRNDTGQLGNNTTTNSNTPVTTSTGGTNWKQVACGVLHTAAVKTDGTLWTWGTNSYAPLGIGYPLEASYTPATFVASSGWKQIDPVSPTIFTIFTSAYSGAIKTDGTLWTWGYNNYGQLGDSTTTQRNTPVTTFAGGTNWKQVSGSTSYTAAIKTDGTLWTWGYNNYGQLGDSTTTQRNTPVTTFAGGTNWKQVSCAHGSTFAGDGHTAAIKTDGTLWTWGARNALGNNDANNAGVRPTPLTTFAGGTNWKQVSCGGYRFTAAIKTDGTLWTWGNNYLGQLGDNTSTFRGTPVTTFAGGTNWSQVACGLGIFSAYTAAIKTDGTLWTWGDNNYGQLGNNTTSQRNTPVTTFAGGTNWKQVSGGDGYTLAIKTDGTLWTWGDNNYGQLGNNTTNQIITPVTTFAGGTNWDQVAGDKSSSIASKTDGTLWTWGYNLFGQLGADKQLLKLIPVTTLAGGTNWKQVACGARHTAALKTDGTLWTWGRNQNSQLGVNDTTSRGTPVTTFAGGTNWKQVVSNQSDGTVAIKTSDDLQGI